MDKLKSVLSHGSKKSVDNTQDTPNSPGGLSGEGSHLAGANSSPASKGAAATGTTAEEYHPIFDQFTGRATSSEPTKTSEEPSDTANLNQPSTSTMEGSTYTEKPESSPSSNLRPDAMPNSKLNTEAMSTASIKSGVLGFPQDGESHAAMGNLPGDRLDATQAETSSALPDRALHHKRDSPDLSKDSALGAAATGTATGVSARELLGRHEEEKPVQQSHALSSDRTADRVNEPVHQQIAQEPAHQHSAIPAQQQSTEGPNVIGDTDRTFPLMGGVTSPQKQEDPATTTTHSTTKHSSTHPETSGYPSSATENTSRSAPANPASEGLAPLTSEREPGTKDRDVGLGDGREALAGAAAAGVATTAASSTKKSEHEHGGHGHNYDGPRYIDEKEKPNTGLVFTEGPHVTDTANVIDPHLHIPGEFPDPTPVEEPSQPSFGTGGTTTGLGSAGRHADTPPSVTSATPNEEHHYGRDAALAGGAGAAGLGAYEASKHHQRETTDIDNEPAIGSSTNPYSSQKLDPRVDSKPRGLEEKRNDLNTSSPQTRDSHLGRDTAVLGGTAGAATLGGYEASKQRPQEQETIQLSSSLPQGQQGITQTQAPSIQQQPATQGISDSTESNKQEHHYGRDAAVVGGLGAAGAGAYAYSQRDNEKDSGPASSTIGPHKSNAVNVVDPRVQPDPTLQKHHEAGPTSEDPASKTVGPHKSNIANILDPRVRPEPEKQKGHTTTGPHQSDTLNRLDPKADQQKQPESQHHYGRDAAVVGGTGAAGYGAYEAAQKYDQHRSTQPGAAMEEQRYDPTAQGAHDPSKTSQHHYGRDAAVVGGVGAAGAGAYAYSQRDQTAQPQSTQTYQQPTTTQQPYSTHQATQEYQPSATQQFTSTQPAAGHQRYDSAQEPREQHNKRDAAAVAGVGAAGAGAAHEYNKHETEKAQQEQLAQQQKELAKKQKEQEHEFKHQQKELEKQQAKDKKEHDKFIAAEEKKHQKEVEKKQAHEQKEHDKLLAAEQKKHQKEVEKQEAQQQKEMDKEQQEEGKEKKHHLFGFLHRDKSKKEKEPGEPDSPTRRSKESPRTSKEYAGLGAAGAAGVGTTAAAYEAGHDSDSSGRKERNRLHKDPPKGHPAREALEHQHEHGGPGIHQHVGIDGPINRPGEISGDRETQHNIYGAHPIDDGKNLVTEPHTGLPMNVEKYGDGHGGTDGSQTVGGYHQAPGAGNQAGAGSTTDWEAIKKANTPF